MKTAAELPARIAKQLTADLKTLREYRLELDRCYRVSGARYEAELARVRGAAAAQADRNTDLFLELASKNGFDGPAIIASLGGRASIALTPAGAEYLAALTAQA